MEKKLPQHIAIIPDGNRRWARSRGLISVEGHREGFKRFREINFAKLPIEEEKKLVRLVIDSSAGIMRGFSWFSNLNLISFLHILGRLRR